MLSGTEAPISSPLPAAAANVTRRATSWARPIPSALFSGSSAGPDGKHAPNITPDPQTGIGSWSEQEIVTLLKEGQTPEFDFVGGAMAEIVRNTARLDDDDRRAIAVYLKSLPPVHSPKEGLVSRAFETGRAHKTSYDTHAARQRFPSRFRAMFGFEARSRGW